MVFYYCKKFKNTESAQLARAMAYNSAAPFQLYRMAKQEESLKKSNSKPKFTSELDHLVRSDKPKMGNAPEGLNQVILEGGFG